MFYNSIIWSHRHGILSKVITQDPDHRLREHNNNMSRYTAGKYPWAFMYLRQHKTNRKAIIEEKRIKPLNNKSIHKVISSPNNIAPPLG